MIAQTKAAPPNNSASGLGVKRCFECSRVTRLTKETIHNGLTIIRVRYGIPYCELPDCEPSSLGRFLSFLLLQGKARPPCSFPRRQVAWEGGLCNLQRLRRHERWELAHGVASIRRNLPQGCRHHTPSSRRRWEANATSQPSPSSCEYLAHVRRETARFFPSGWDKKYRRFVCRHLPNPSSRLPKDSRADHLWSGRQEEFLSATLDGSDVIPRFFARYRETPSAGKCRPMLIFDEKIEWLAPLHRTLFDALRRTDWLLVGPPTEDKMTSVCANDFQTSVDLVNASDGLAHDVARAVLDTVFAKAKHIPRSIRSLAYASLTPSFFDERGVVKTVSHGQMMGAYLSFPLLCLQSYCAASWASRDCNGARILVNGDDAVISAEREINACDYPPGYQLNVDKTIRAAGVVEVNSTTFLRRGGRWREVRHLRRGGAPSDYRGMIHMSTACVNAGPAYVDAFQRARIGRRWGFMPSQLGHWTYPARLREQGLIRKGRYFTPLPDAADKQDESGLRRICGRDARPLEIQSLIDFLWIEGRRTESRSFVYNPSHGYIRRSYGYRRLNSDGIFLHSFVGWREKGKEKPSGKPRYFLVPEDWVTDEEAEGLHVLDLWRRAIDSLAV